MKAGCIALFFMVQEAIHPRVGLFAAKAGASLIAPGLFILY
jgi:hypothetical protein